jgi:hypothetical protein
MPNPVFPPSSLIHGKASPAFSYVYDSEMDSWRPLNPEDFVGAGISASGYRNPDLKGEKSLVSDRASRLAGFLVDTDFDDEPLFVQFYSYHTGVPILTYPLYAQSSIDQNFTSPIGGFQGILIGITTDKSGVNPWNGSNGQGILANVYYKY